MRVVPIVLGAFVTLACKSALAASCVRPADPMGYDGYDYGAATVQSFGNEKVLVWYVTEGPNAVSSVTTQSSGAPDDVALVAQITSDALDSYRAMGYRSPVADDVDPGCGSDGGDERLDVYLAAMVGADGLTVAEPGRCTTLHGATRCAGFILAKANFSTTYPSAEIGIRTVLPHETFHMVQDAYDTALDRFWAEGTAQWAAKTLDPSLDDLERFLPAFFDAPNRALDAPADGVTSSFLYGSAIWPVYLTGREGDEVVRAILEEEGASGASALEAADTVLKARGTSLALEYPIFSAWNVGTGDLAGGGGYPEAATYPGLMTETLAEDGSVSGATSGLSSHFFRVSSDASRDYAIDTDPARNAALFVPIENGAADVTKATPLPTSFQGDGVVLVSAITTGKTDAPFTLSSVVSPMTAVTPPVTGPATHSDSATSSGCAVSSSSTNDDEALRVAIALAALGFTRFARHRRARRSIVRSVFVLMMLLVIGCNKSKITGGAAASSSTEKPAAPRIVSLGGAVTETIFALGGGDEVIGVDTSSVYPQAATKLAKVGYQRTVGAEAVLALSPTLIIASNEAGPPAALEQLKNAGVRVEIVSVEPNLAGAHDRIIKIASILGRDPKALLATLDSDLERAHSLAAKVTTHPKVLALYARGQGNLFVFGQKTAAASMVELAASENAVTAFEGTKALTSEAVAGAAPDVIVIPARGLESVGGLDGLLALPGVVETPAGKAKRVITEDDLLLLGFGPRTGAAAIELLEKLHPELTTEKAAP